MDWRKSKSLYLIVGSYFREEEWHQNASADEGNGEQHQRGGRHFYQAGQEEVEVQISVKDRRGEGKTVVAKVVDEPQITDDGDAL